MRVFIAEKPNVAIAMAAVLGAINKKDSYIECGKDYVTWCFGHMYEQAEPDIYAMPLVSVFLDYAALCWTRNEPYRTEQGIELVSLFWCWL